MQQFFKNAAEVWASSPRLRSKLVFSHEPQAAEKFFDPAIFQKCWRGVGEQPTFAKQVIFAVCFSCCNCIFENYPIQTKLYYENQGCKFEQGNGAIAARW